MVKRFYLGRALIACAFSCLVALNGCAAGPQPEAEVVDVEAAIPEPIEEDTGPGSDAWLEQINEYFGKYGALADRQLAVEAAYNEYVDAWASDSVTAARRDALLATPGELRQVLAEAQGVDPPEEVRGIHEAFVQSLDLQIEAMELAIAGYIGHDANALDAAADALDAAADAFEALAAEHAAFGELYF